MAQITVLALVSAILVLIATLWFRRNKGKRSSKLPPGSMGWPFIGETLPFLKPHSSFVLGDFMEHRISRYGEVFMSHLFGSPTIVSTDPELNRFVLKNDLRLFGIGWNSCAVKLLGKSSIVVLVGDDHRRMRSFFLGFLSPTRLRTVFLKDAERLASLLFSSWEDDGSVVCALHETMKFTFNFTVNNLISMNPGDAETEKLRKEFECFVKAIFSLPLNFPGTAHRKGLQSRSNILKVIKQKTDERRQNKLDGVTTLEQDDFLDWLMKNTDCSEEEIGDNLLALLFAGHHTSARTLTFAIYFLHDCPEALRQLQEEHLQVIRSKKEEGKKVTLTWDDYKQMEFTQCVINETLRLSHVAEFILKGATEDVQFKEYEIPKGCNIAIHLAAVHMNPSIFEDPGHFNPWRWMSSSHMQKTNNFMPFSGGTRLCPGAELARLQMNVFLHKLILNYTWKIVEPDRATRGSFINPNEGLLIKIHAISSC